MMLKMLQAVSEMLEYKDDKDFKIRVECAKIILDKVIEELKEKDTKPSIPIFPGLPNTPQRVPDTSTENGYKVIVADDSKLVRIEGLGMDELVEIDGQIMTHKDAIGKNFSSGRIV